MTPHIHTRTFGSGPRQVLAIHCSLAHSGAWRGVAEALEPDLTMRAYDLPMHGRSGDWDGSGDIHDVATAMGHSVLDERMDVIGHSFGATVALRLAIEAPERVRSVTIIEPVYFAPLLADGLAQKSDFFAGTPDLEAALEAQDLETAARLFNRGWGDGTRWDEIPEATRAYMTERIRFVPASTAFLRDDNAGLLAPGRFARAAMPALLLEGSRSHAGMPAIVAAIGRRLPDASHVVIEGAGHMAPISHPGPVAAEIRRFLARVPAD